MNWSKLDPSCSLAANATCRTCQTLPARMRIFVQLHLSMPFWSTVHVRNGYACTSLVWIRIQVRSAGHKRMRRCHLLAMQPHHCYVHYVFRVVAHPKVVPVMQPLPPRHAFKAWSVRVLKAWSVHAGPHVGVLMLVRMSGYFDLYLY